MNNGLPDILKTAVQQNHGSRHVRFNQQYRGVPVYHSDVVVSIDNRNYVTFVSNNYKPGITVESVQPSVSSSSALTIARNYFQITQPNLRKAESTLLVYAENETPRLAYQIIISSTEPNGSWEVIIDAQTGEILHSKDLRMYRHANEKKKPAKPAFINGTGYIFNPDPLTSSHNTYNTPGYNDNNNADSPELNAERILVTLNDISSSGSFFSLSGPYVSITDWDPPFIAPVLAANADSFRFLRSQTEFEDVNVYYHIDKAQRRIQSLGFTDIQNLSIQTDPHGVNGGDNSYFDTGLNSLSFGDGGVDDAEDADVIWHEYGHAIQWGTVDGFGGTDNGNEEGALGEGFGDYWAGSYSRSLDNVFSRNFVFTWDAGFTGTTGSLWPGRPLNLSSSYPVNGVGGMEVHDAGQYWSSVLMLIWDDIGRDTLDRLVLKSHYYLSTYATMRDNAEAILQADLDLYGGSHVTKIATRFAQRNFLPPPTFSHSPLRDTENSAGPYSTKIIVTPGYFPIASNGVKLFWTRDTLFIDSVICAPTGSTYEYSAAIPGNDTAGNYRYYFSGEDLSGTVTHYPANVPAQYFSFYAGPDTVVPVLTFSPVYNPSKMLWPPVLQAKAKDNIGVDSVWVEYIRQRGTLAGSFPLSAINDSTFSGEFALDTSQITIGDSIFYSVNVKDKAQTGNITKLPSSGTYSFAVSKIKVLVGTQGTSSSSLLYNVLSIQDIALDVIAWNGLIPTSTVLKYDLLIITTGVNATPNISKRADIITRVGSGGRVWIEGGEVGAYFQEPPNGVITDPTFRRVVLHDSIWIGDVTSSGLTLTQSSNALFTTPNTIASPIVFTTTTTKADRDAMLLIPGDPGVSSPAQWTAGPPSAGIVTYTPKNYLSPQTIFFSFALSSITDTTAAKKLIVNTLFTFFPQLGLTGVEDKNHTIPISYSIEQNFPNPFNPQTTIRINIPSASLVSMKIYDILGREVISLMNEKKEAGVYEIPFNAGNLASGVYLYRMIAVPLISGKEIFSDSHKMLLIK